MASTYKVVTTASNGRSIIPQVLANATEACALAVAWLDKRGSQARHPHGITVVDEDGQAVQHITWWHVEALQAAREDKQRLLAMRSIADLRATALHRIDPHHTMDVDARRDLFYATSTELVWHALCAKHEGFIALAATLHGRAV